MFKEPICPRCREIVPAKWKIPPVSLCLPCYSLIPENAHLTYMQLRDKAAKSTYAKKRALRERQRMQKLRWEEAEITPEVLDAEMYESQAAVADTVQSILDKAAGRRVSKNETDPTKS